MYLLCHRLLYQQHDLPSQALTVFGASEAQAPEGEALSVLESYDETAAVEVQQED